MPNKQQQSPYLDLRQRARALALATLFDKAEARDNICDLLQLGLELEKILEIASEPMLAMIRMQWWCDMFDAPSPPQEAPEFAKRLYHLQAIDNQAIRTFISAVQDTLQTPEPHMMWDRLFAILVLSNNWQIDGAVMRQLGRNFGALYSDDAKQTIQPLSDKDIKDASQSSYGFPRLVNLLINRQMAGKSNEDYALIFRMVARLFY